jgi:hypothetical protein
MNKTTEGTEKGTAKRRRESRKSGSREKEPMTLPEMEELKKKFEKATGVGKSSRPPSLPEVKPAWEVKPALGGKRHRKTAKRRRAKKSRGWFW